jgi:predicted AlkP superfamily phosphohydrolase/phosphomutase
MLAKEYELDFLHLTIFYINSLHHDLWNDKVVEQAWELLDRNIGDLVNDFKGSNVIIMSDHGTNEIKQVFYINTWLEKQGYLRTSGSLWLPRLLYRLGLNEESLFKIAQRLHLNNILKRVVPKRLRANIPSAIGTVELEQKEGKVVWEKSQALASGQGPLYLAAGDSRLRAEIMGKLKELTNPLTGQKIAHQVYKREDIYKGDFLAEAPDIIIDQSPHTHIRGSIGNKNVFEEPKRWRAENTTRGIFIASGPDFKQGVEVENVAILDLAPTILHLMGLPVPADVDGRVLSEAFKKGPGPVERAKGHRS